MNKTILCGTLCLSAAASYAQTKPTATPAPKEIECAVMKGHKLEVADATKKKMYADYKGRRYFFCCAGCKPEFNKTPAKFVKAPSIPIPAKK